MRHRVSQRPEVWVPNQVAPPCAPPRPPPRVAKESGIASVCSPSLSCATSTRLLSNRLDGLRVPGIQARCPFTALLAGTRALLPPTGLGRCNRPGARLRRPRTEHAQLGCVPAPALPAPLVSVTRLTLLDAEAPAAGTPSLRVF